MAHLKGVTGNYLRLPSEAVHLTRTTRSHFQNISAPGPAQLSIHRKVERIVQMASNIHVH